MSYSFPGTRGMAWTTPARKLYHMVFQYTPAGFEEFFVENGTQAGMPAKERTAEEYAATGEKYGMVYKDSVNK